MIKGKQTSTHHRIKLYMFQESAFFSFRKSDELKGNTQSCLWFISFPKKRFFLVTRLHFPFQLCFLFYSLCLTINDHFFVL